MEEGKDRLGLFLEESFFFEGGGGGGVGKSGFTQGGFWSWDLLVGVWVLGIF